jgi:hypothetical protein
MGQPATWRDYATIQALRIPELVGILTLAESAGEGHAARRVWEQARMRYRAWCLSVEDDLTQYFQDYQFLEHGGVHEEACRLGLDIRKQSDFIRFYRSDMTMGALWPLPARSEDWPRSLMLRECWNILASLSRGKVALFVNIF